MLFTYLLTIVTYNFESTLTVHRRSRDEVLSNNATITSSF
nr:MAG TPA: hypothetical protein [Caudoviricetes sp.]